MLQGQTYVPLLYVKRAELRALSALDKVARDTMFPILVGRPGDHHDLNRTWDLISSAVGNYRFGFDIDRNKLGKCPNSPAREQFDALFDTTDGFSNYYSMIESLEGAVPVLQMTGGLPIDIEQQIKHIQRLDRGVVVRIERGHTHGLETLLAAGTLDGVDKLFVVDAGWALDVLQLESWGSPIITAITSYYPEAEIACLSSSFPTAFDRINDKGVFTIDDRFLFDNLVRRHNAARLTYGDWGSTRTSEERRGAKPKPRIDVASTTDWTCFRMTKDESGFQQVAVRTQSDALWSRVPDCWGKRTVECSALNIPGRITGTEIATSTRINIHLTVQALSQTDGMVPDEPYVDNF